MQQTAEQIGALVAAVAAATGEIGAVAKSGRNTHDRYTYSSDEDFARAVQPVMARHGLALVPIQMDADWYDTQTGKGRTMRGCVLRVRWLLMHSGGGTQELCTIGEGIDRADKAAFKAQTGARKYALRLAFQTPTSDDAEQHSPPVQRSTSTEPADARAQIRARLIEASRAGALTHDQGRSLMALVDAATEQQRTQAATELQSVQPADVASALERMMEVE